MRPGTLFQSAIPVLAAALFLGNPWAKAEAAPLAERLVGQWSCQAQENDAAIAMTLNYRLSNGWLIGEITEDNGATLLDVWLDDGFSPLALRRVLSYDATVEMKLVEETAERIKLEGAMRHIVGNGGPVREELRFTGNDRFDALWEADLGEEWVPILTRSCRRSS